MDFIKLNDKRNMPVLGLVTYLLKGSECEKCVSEAINLGYRLIDTAQMYGNEKAVGNAIKHYKRNDLFVTTKLYSPSTGYERAKSDIEKSLNNLQTDYIDLLLYTNLTEKVMQCIKQWKKRILQEKSKPLAFQISIKSENINIFDFELDSDDIEKIMSLDKGRTLFGWY